MKLDTPYFRKGEAEIRNYIYIRKPEAIKSAKDIEHYYARTAQAISDAENTIKLLQEYQQALYTRYQEICNANYKLFLFLERRVHFDNSKSYYITISKKFTGNNIADEPILQESFSGKERHKALKRFEALKKEYPNIEHDTDIEKKGWER